MKATGIAKITRAITRTAGKAWFKTKQASPEIMLVGGILCIAAGTYFAVEAGRKIDDILDEAKAEREELENDAEEIVDALNDCEDAGQEAPLVRALENVEADILVNKRQTAWKIAKVCAPFVGFELAGIGLIGGSHYILRDWLGKSMTAYNALLAAYNNYRKRVIDAYGEDVDEDFRLGRHRNADGEIVDKNGNPINMPTVMDFDANPGDILTLDLNRFSAPGFWDPNPNYLFTAIVHAQNLFNNNLDLNYEVTLREVLKHLGLWDGLSKEQRALAMIYGWRHGGKGSQTIDFGLSRGPIEDYKFDDDLTKNNVRLRFNAYPILLDYTKATEDYDV